MHEQVLNTQQPEEQQEGAPAPRRTWERPVLQRLHVSLDTASKTGSQNDGGTPTIGFS